MLKYVAPKKKADGIDPVPTLLTHLKTGNEVIRTDAIRAIATRVHGDDRAREALLAALLDQDPDVRSDAMDALVHFAHIEDAPKIRDSLMGDPVREVKLAAIDLLTALKDHASVPLFRKLTLGRAEDEVEWEDEAGMWDEWLEIQIACIRALGKFGAEEAIKDILAARDDEFGQNLDLPVFEALTGMGSEGMVWLLAVAQTEDGLARKRALEAMTKIDPDALRPHVDFLLGDDNAAVRRLALTVLPSDDDRLAYIAHKDVEASLRSLALEMVAASRPDLVVAALSDPSKEVQAVALDHLTLPLDDDLAEALGDNMQAWLLTDDGALATSVARNWFRLQDGASHDPLLTLIRDTDRPLEARLAAVEGLAKLEDTASCERLISLLSNPAQQIRAVVLTQLATRAGQGDEVACEALVVAAEGALLAPKQTSDEADVADRPQDQATEEEGIPRLHITKEGEISTTTEGDGTGSTLEAIQINRVAPKEPGKKGKKEHKRQAIEGPEDLAHDLARVALGMMGNLPAAGIGEAIRSMTECVKDDLRIAAYQVMAKRHQAGLVAAEDLPRVAAGLMDRTAIARSLACQMAATQPELRDALMALRSDPDAMVRLECVSVLADPKYISEALADEDARVRKAALMRALSENIGVAERDVFERLQNGEQITTLRHGVEVSESFAAIVYDKLSAEDLPIRETHVLLQALSA